jgi:hypothetical protein
MVHGLIMDAGHIYIPGAEKSISRTAEIVFCAALCPLHPNDGDLLPNAST